MKILLLIIALKAFLFVCYLSLTGAPGLCPDEAQYWTWSQELQLGYYSKPPLIAYLIAATTALFGSTVFGVKAVGLIAGSLLPLAVYALAKTASLDERGCLVAALATLFSPLGFLSTFYATTDGPMVLFWTLALALWLAKREESYPGVGLLIALGALVKWPAYLLWLFFLPFVKNWRGFLLGVAISLLGLLPPLIWNIQEGFPTFRHVAATALGGSQGKALPNPLDFFAAQAFLMSPLFFFLFLAGFFFKDRRFAVRFLGCQALLILLFYQLASFNQKIQGNWCVFLYPAAFVFTVAVWENGKVRLAALAVAFLSSLLLFAAPFLPLPLKMNPFKECMGWEKIPAILEANSYDYLVSPTYQLTSLLSFYGGEKERAYLLAVPGRRLSQFDFWPTLQDREEGRIGLFVATSEKERWERELPLIFSEVRALGSYPLIPGRELILFSVKGLVKEPERQQLY